MWKHIKQLIIDQRRLREVEERILEISVILTDEKRRKDFAKGVAMPIFEGRLVNANRPLIAEKERLEQERLFLIDRRDSLSWRFVWNIIIPILVTIITVLVLSFFGLEKV